MAGAIIGPRGPRAAREDGEAGAGKHVRRVAAPKGSEFVVRLPLAGVEALE